MKKLLFLLLTLLPLLTDAQIGAFRAGVHSPRHGDGSPVLSPLSSIPYIQLNGEEEDLHYCARVDTEYTGLINVPDGYTVAWALIESKSVYYDGSKFRGDTLVAGTTKNVVHTFTDSEFDKSYDIGLTVKWSASDSISRILRRGIRNVWDYKYVEGGPGITTYDLSTAGGFYTSPPATNRVILKGIRGGGSMYFNNWTNVRIQVQVAPDNTPAQINGTNGNLRIGSGCSGLTIDACTSQEVQYGLVLNPSNSIDCFVIDPGSTSTNFTEDVTIGGIKTTAGTVGFHIGAYPSDPNPGPPLTQLADIHIFNCFAIHSNNEGFYLGWTRDYEGRTELLNPVYHHLRTDSTGWDGFQPGNSVGAEIHNLLIEHSGLLNNSNQYSDFSINGINGIIYYTTLIGGRKSFTGSTGSYHGGVHIFYCTVISSATENIQQSWYRLGDGSGIVNGTYDFCLYNNSFSSIKDVIGLYCCSGCGGCGSATGDFMNFHFDDNELLINSNGVQTPYIPPSSSYLVNNPYTKHWLTRFDIDGYLIQ